MSKTLKLLLISFLPLLVTHSHAGEFDWSQIGLRIGVDAENRVEVNSYELITQWESPWSWSANDSFSIDLDLELGLGALEGEGETGWLTHIGPSIEIEFGDFPLEVIISSGPALLSEHEYDNLDLGGSFQFMSAVGFDLELSDKWTIGYRYLHISNAGLHDENPGINLHALSAFYEF